MYCLLHLQNNVETSDKEWMRSMSEKLEVDLDEVRDLIGYNASVYLHVLSGLALLQAGTCSNSTTSQLSHQRCYDSSDAHMQLYCCLRVSA